MPPSRTNVTTGMSLPRALLDRARGAADALAGAPHRLSVSGIVTRALERELTELEATHHGGLPWPAPPGKLRTRTAGQAR